MGALDGKVALITGAGSGIGKATVARFAAEGATICAVDFDDTNGKAVADSVNGLYVHADAGDATEVDAMFATCERELGGVDIAYLNAGIAIGVGDITTLTDADYPARLDVPYPERLSRGLVLVKSWLLAIPHYMVLAVLIGNWGWTLDGDHWTTWGLSLNGILVLIAVVILLFTGRYPRDIFGIVLGINRWALRVAAYVMLMRDEYPPFRLDR